MTQEKDILAGADDRIKKYRTANLTVEVVDKKGNPLPQAQVEVRQTRHEFLFGSHFFEWEWYARKEKETYEKQFAELFNYASLAFCWRWFEPEQNKPKFEQMNKSVEWCEAHNITLQGHLLMWNHHGCSPLWLQDNPEQIVKECDARVRDIVSYYEGRIQYYILVNEPTDCFREEAPLHGFDTAVTRAWKHEGRIPFTKRFFPIAHQADPAAKQLINDYRISKPFEDVIEQLVDERGRPLYDIIGLQSHMHCNYWGAEKVWGVFERFARFKKPLHFTESTQHSGRLRNENYIRRMRGDDSNWKTTKSGEIRQANEVAEFYTLLFSHPAVEAVSWFELVDYGWRGCPGGLFYACSLAPKPAYEKLHSLIKGAWWTQTKSETNAKGKCSVRAFYGNYAITAQRGAAQKSVQHHHTKGANASLKIVL